MAHYKDIDVATQFLPLTNYRNVHINFVAIYSERMLTISLSERLTEDIIECLHFRHYVHAETGFLETKAFLRIERSIYQYAKMDIYFTKTMHSIYIPQA